MKQLEGKEVKIVKEEGDVEKPKIKVFSDHLRFDYTRRLAEKLRDDGIKAAFMDIMTLVIHPMDKELFNSTVDNVSDVLTCYIPEDLYDDFVLKSNDVFRIIKYRPGEEDIKTSSGTTIVQIDKESFKTGWLDSLISGIISSLTSSLTGLATFITSDRFVKKIGKKKEIYLTQEIEGVFKSIVLEVSGGIIDVKKGRPKVVAWETDSGRPDVSFEIKDDTLEIYCSNGYIELYIEDKDYEAALIDVTGGVVKGFPGTYNMVKMDLTGGVITNSIGLSGNGKLALDVGGGMIKTNVKAAEGFKQIEFDINGGYLEINLETIRESIDIDIDRLGGYIDVRLDGESVGFKHIVGGEMKIRGNISGGYGKLHINRK